MLFRSAKATFFVTGTNENYYDLIKKAHDQGHTIGLHTYIHEYDQIYNSSSAYFSDLKKIEDLVYSQIGSVPKYIRFPGGSSNQVSKKYCHKIMSKLTKEVVNRGYQYYDWNEDSEDGSGQLSVKQLIKNATASTEKNIMFHVDTYLKKYGFTLTAEARGLMTEMFHTWSTLSLLYVFSELDKLAIDPDRKSVV